MPPDAASRPLAGDEGLQDVPQPFLPEARQRLDDGRIVGLAALCRPVRRILHNRLDPIFRSRCLDVVCVVEFESLSGSFRKKPQSDYPPVSGRRREPDLSAFCVKAFC